MSLDIPITRPCQAIAVVCAIALLACRGGDARPQPSPAETLYPLRGVVKGVAADRKSVAIDHEEIPGFMPRMEMEYVVADPAMLDGIGTGAEVEGTLRARGHGLLIVALKKRAAATPAAGPASTPAGSR